VQLFPCKVLGAIKAKPAAKASAVSPPLALEAQEVPPPANNDTASGSSSTLPVDKVAASPTLSEPSNREMPVLEATTMEKAPVRPAGITHAKRVRVGRHRQEATGRRWVRYGDRMPAPDQIQAAASTVLQTPMSDT
jgi:hypothetical protein